MGTKINLEGQTFGRLKVIKEADPFHSSGRTRRMWLCQCDCGNTLVVRGENLKGGNTKSCGCYQKTQVSQSNGTHHMSRTRLYYIWQGMKERCCNPNSKPFPDYGGRGITICDEWLNFIGFKDWAYENGYQDDLTLDRINNDGNYEPSNCRWTDLFTQGRNKRNNRLMTFNGETHCLSEWVEITGIKYGTLLTRIMNGWTVEDTLTKPVRRREKR